MGLALTYFTIFVIILTLEIIFSFKPRNLIFIETPLILVSLYAIFKDTFNSSKEFSKTMGDTFLGESQNNDKDTEIQEHQNTSIDREKDFQEKILEARNFIFFSSAFIGYLVAKHSLQHISIFYNTYIHDILMWLIEANILSLGWVPEWILEWAPPKIPDLSIIVLNSLHLIIGGLIYWPLLWFFINKSEQEILMT